MKAEIMHVQNKGLCLVISGLDFVGSKIDISRIAAQNSPFHDIHAIADCIAGNLKIPAIKEVRAQTGWGLKEAKLYIDKYLPMRSNLDARGLAMASKKFIEDHTYVVEDFLDKDEFAI